MDGSFSTYSGSPTKLDEVAVRKAIAMLMIKVMLDELFPKPEIVFPETKPFGNMDRLWFGRTRFNDDKWNSVLMCTSI